MFSKRIISISFLIFISLLFTLKPFDLMGITFSKSSQDLLNSSVLRQWEATNYENQPPYLGLEKNDFAPPKSLQKAVQFWIKIYTESTTTQGLIHDSENLGIIYESIDFNFIDQNETLNQSQKMKAREKYIEERKKLILADLINLQSKGLNSTDLTESEQKLRDIFEKIDGPKPEIKELAEKERIRFQLGQSNRIKQGIFWSGRYLPMMEQVFKEQNLPLQLTRLAFVESSFDFLARSKVGASGLWQIMRSAARGRLRINKIVDLRNHPIEATEAAAKILKFNYQMLSSWPLAVTAYNHGPYGVKRLTEKNHSRDIGELIESGEGRRFGFASRNFYACFLAILEVESKANEFFPGIKRAPPMEDDEERFLKKPIYFKELVKQFDGDRELALMYNPHFQTRIYDNSMAIPINVSVNLDKNLRAKSEDIFDTKKNDISVHNSSNEISPSKNNHQLKKKLTVLKDSKSKASDNNEFITYKVTRGDTLYGIAKQFNISIKSILAKNDIKRKRRIRPGQILILETEQ